MSQFAFLDLEWPALYEAASRAEETVHADPRTACFYARRALEIAVSWAYKHDAALKLPYQDNLSALIHDPTFKQTAGEAVFNKARVITILGNHAVHSQRAVAETDAQAAVTELFHVAYWFARTYALTTRPDPLLTFDPAKLPRPAATPRLTTEELQTIQAGLKERDEKLATLLADKNALDDELKRLRDEVAASKRAAEAQPDTHDYSEAATRDYYLDLLLNEAGWPLTDTRDREYEITGMPNTRGNGYVDYVLWGDDGKPVGLVEAKRTKRDSRVGQQQAKLYADALERQYGQRPIIYYSNGYEHWLWDDQRYPPRRVQGFHKKTELQLLIQRRATRRSLANTQVNTAIVERHYQTRAVRRVAEAFETDNDRKALLVMATGAGKTRTVIALADLLIRANWVKRVLFLADRVALVNQAVNAFKKHLPDSSPVNLVTEKDTEGRVYVSTYPTMMGLIDETLDGQRRFGPGHFDLVIIDEAHRSVFHKYRAIFDYYDALLVGLTATPKDEVDRNTYNLFDLENGVPTDAYSLEEAVRDGYLVPPTAISVPLRFQREGITYDELPDDDKDEWDALEWSEDGTVPDRIEAAAINRWLFNADTVDKVLKHVMTRGLKVAGGDRLGKTIVFAKNQAHADYIAERFDTNYPHLRGEFARTITYNVEYAQSLIDDFSQTDKAPHIAISVDMLDTGIDVPDVVNLVFFKPIRSKTKFWQMLGRGTRLRPDLYGPGKDKNEFYVFDYCQNLEYFSQNLPGSEGNLAAPLGKRLFTTRLELVASIDASDTDTAPNTDPDDTTRADPTTDRELRHATANLLRAEVTAMNLENFVVRPHRRTIEKYQDPVAWEHLTSDDVTELTHTVAGLPTELEPEPETAKRFDMLALKLQLGVLRPDPNFAALHDRVKEIAARLEEKATIPMVQSQLELIQAVQTDEWWHGVTLPMLEIMRRRLRDLVQFIDRSERKLVYTDFEDTIGEGTAVDLGGLSVGTDLAKFLDKARAFLKQHVDHALIAKLRHNQPLTPDDLTAIERFLIDGCQADPQHLKKAAEQANGLGLFIRSIVGMDHAIAKSALAAFLAGKTHTANQIEFVNLVVAHLAEHGYVEVGTLYQSPFTDIAPHGPEGLFDSGEINQLFGVLEAVRTSALA